MIESDLNQADNDLAKGNVVGAIKEYQKILSSDPTEPEALTGEGWTLASTGDPTLLQQGLKLLASAEQSNPTYAPAHVYRGLALLSEDDYADSVPELKWYLAHSPDPQLVSKVRTELQQAEVGAAAEAKASAGSTGPGSNGDTDEAVGARSRPRSRRARRNHSRRDRRAGGEVATRSGRSEDLTRRDRGLAAGSRPRSGSDGRRAGRPPAARRRADAAAPGRPPKAGPGQYPPTPPLSATRPRTWRNAPSRSGYRKVWPAAAKRAGTTRWLASASSAAPSRPSSS